MESLVNNLCLSPRKLLLPFVQQKLYNQHKTEKIQSWLKFSSHILVNLLLNCHFKFIFSKWGIKLLKTLSEWRVQSYGAVTLNTTRCPSCFSVDTALLWLECVSEPSVHDLSLQTLGSSIMSRGASLFKIKQENISLFPLLHLLSPFLPLHSLSDCLFLSFCLR